MRILKESARGLDKLDRHILRILQQDGRISMKDLGEQVGLSITPCIERVKRMERDGVITGYHAKVNLCSFFFVEPSDYDEKTVKKRWKEYSAQQMTELAEVIEGINDFSVENQESVVMKWVEEKEYKLGDVMNAFRLTLVGIGKGPGMFDISAFLGKEETLKRLRKAIEVLK